MPCWPVGIRCKDALLAVDDPKSSASYVERVDRGVLDLRHVTAAALADPHQLGCCVQAVGPLETAAGCSCEGPTAEVLGINTGVNCKQHIFTKMTFCTARALQLMLVRLLHKKPADAQQHAVAI